MPSQHFSRSNQPGLSSPKYLARTKAAVKATVAATPAGSVAVGMGGALGAFARCCFDHGFLTIATHPPAAKSKPSPVDRAAHAAPKDALSARKADAVMNPKPASPIRPTDISKNKRQSTFCAASRALPSTPRIASVRNWFTGATWPRPKDQRSPQGQWPVTDDRQPMPQADVRQIFLFFRRNVLLRQSLRRYQSPYGYRVFQQSR